MKTIWALATVGSLGSLLLTGCGGGSEQSDSMSGTARAPAAPAAAGPDGRAAAGGSAQDTLGKSAPGSGGRSGGLASVPATGAGPVAGRSVVYTADLRVRAKDVGAGAESAKQIVLAAGGYVSTESSGTRPPTAFLTFKIPADRYAGVLAQLSGRIGERLGLRQQADDVTEEVADVDSRVRSARSTLASFRRLLDRANTIGEVLNVEQEISQREADLEALQARQKSLAQQTRFATVSMQIEGSQATRTVHRRTHGFVGGLKSGWSAFTGLLSGLALLLGWLLPFLPAAAVLAAVGLWLRRRSEARRRANAPAALERDAPAAREPDVPAAREPDIPAAREPDPDADGDPDASRSTGGKPGEAADASRRSGDAAG